MAPSICYNLRRRRELGRVPLALTAASLERSNFSAGLPDWECGAAGRAESPVPLRLGGEAARMERKRSLLKGPCPARAHPWVIAKRRDSGRIVYDTSSFTLRRHPLRAIIRIERAA